MAKERTLLLVKPDAVNRGLIGEVLKRYEDRGCRIAAMKMLWMTREMAEELYKPHKGKSFYEFIVGFMTSAPIVACIVEGEEAIHTVRVLNGATHPKDAHPGTIRGDFAQRAEFNCVHGSDCPDSAKREMAIFFKEEEYLDYERVIQSWL